MKFYYLVATSALAMILVSLSGIKLGSAINQTVSPDEGFDRSIIGTVINITNNTGPPVQRTPSGFIDWLSICKNPIVDRVVTEPCETLTTPDGYTLTQEGKRLVACFLGASLLLAVDRTGAALTEAQQLASEAGLCG